MPELRQNPISKDWVIVAPERHKRPDQFRYHAIEDRISTKDGDEEVKCPFCPGNEEISGKAILTYRKDSEGVVKSNKLQHIFKQCES